MPRLERFWCERLTPLVSLRQASSRERKPLASSLTQTRASCTHDGCFLRGSETCR